MPLDLPQWTTACPDWERRILAGESLVPCPPLFPAEADAALDYFKDLKIVDAYGSPTMGQACKPWVFDFVRAVFGGYDPDAGRRLIRYFFLLVSKKNSKSTVAAGIMLTALLRNWRESAEFLILAPTIEVARNSFDPAFDMVRADEDLSRILHPMPATRTIEHKNTHATLKVVAADDETVSGKKATGVLVDELWLFGKRHNAENMLREAMGGLASRPEGFVIYLSTQSDTAPAGVFAQRLADFRGIRDGKISDPKSMPVLYEFPKQLVDTGKFRDPAWFHVTNPNIGASVDMEFLLDEAAKSERAGEASYRGFAAKHLNIEIGVGLRADGWAGAELWERGIQDGLTLDTLLARSEVVTIGIDGGGLDDLLAIAVIGREKITRRWFHWSHAFISPEGWDRRKANSSMYEGFIEDGDLTLVHTLPDDITALVEIVARVDRSGLLAMVGVDKYGVGGIVDALAMIGITQDDDRLGGVPQGIALMSAIKTVERKLADGSFRHGNQPIMAWCAGNAKIIPTPTAIRIEREASGYGKIDPLMATFDAAELMLRNPEAQGQSYLATADELALV